MLSRYDRIVLTLIALGLAVVALNPWVAPGYVSAQGGVVQVDIVGVAGKAVLSTYQNGTLPVEIVGSVSIQR